MSLPVAAILVAAGQSRRFGARQDVDRHLGPAGLALGPGCAAVRARHGLVALVVPADGVERFTDALPPDAGDRVQVVGGGEERTDSVVAGITALTAAGVAEETPVLVHDAARPAASPELMVRVVSAVRAGTGAVPVVADARLAEDGRCGGAR